jgi:hypothetical protein
MPSYSAGATKAGQGAGIAAGGIESIASFLPQGGGKGAAIATQSLFTAASAANAIPVAGQFVSAGLAIAGLFVKIFAGRKKKRREEARKKREARLDTAKDAVQASSDSSGGVGTSSGQGPVGATAPVSGPQAPSFSSWGGGSAPAIQPTQAALNNKLGV